MDSTFFKRLNNTQWKPLTRKANVASGFLRLLRSLRSGFTSFSAPVRRAVASGLAASFKASANNRTYLALLLMLVAAPLSGVAYQLFDSTAVVEGWYYKNYFYLLFVLSPHLHMVIALVGVFLLFNNDRGYFVAIPAGYHVAQIMWLITVEKNADLHSVVPGAFLLVAMLATVVGLFTFNYLMGLHYHKVLGPICSALGIANAPGVDDSTKVEVIRERLTAALNATK